MVGARDTRAGVGRGRGSISSAMAHGLENNRKTVDVALAIMGNQMEQGRPLGSSCMGPEVTNG